jgi:hypothetical protein
VSMHTSPCGIAEHAPAHALDSAATPPPPTHTGCTSPHYCLLTTRPLSPCKPCWPYSAEDFLPFDVDVTTIRPSTFAYPSGNLHVMIGGSGSWYGSAGGVAYVGIWNISSTTYYQPAFVFPDMLGRSAKNIWEATSHEVGHNMVRRHMLCLAQLVVGLCENHTVGLRRLGCTPYLAELCAMNISALCCPAHLPPPYTGPLA